MTKQDFPPLKPKVVLGISAHPDDLDFSCSATMAGFAKAGAKVYYLILTDGGKGSEDREMSSETLRDMRREEQRNAGKILGLADVFFCDYPDGTLQNSMDVKRDVVRRIRQVKPDVVVTMDPSVLYNAERGMINHPDHRAAGQAALDAVYPLARDHMSFPELLEEGLEPHKTKTVLMTNFVTSNFAMDVSDTIDLKFEALKKHTSQVPADMTQLKERFMDWATQSGSAYGYKFAETFVRIDLH